MRRRQGTRRTRYGSSKLRKPMQAEKLLAQNKETARKQDQLKHPKTTKKTYSKEVRVRVASRALLEPKGSPRRTLVATTLHGMRKRGKKASARSILQEAKKRVRKVK